MGVQTRQDFCGTQKGGWVCKKDPSSESRGAAAMGVVVDFHERVAVNLARDFLGDVFQFFTVLGPKEQQQRCVVAYGLREPSYLSAIALNEKKETQTHAAAGL